jgi:hypothetical protein
VFRDAESILTIPQHPFRSQWHPIEVDVVGYRLVDTIETAALEAIHIFCNQHSMEVAGHPISLFPTIDSCDPEWNFRIAHYGHMLGDSAEETLRGTIRFMNVQHHYQILLRRGMGQLIGIAQGHYRNADQQVTQIVELQTLVTEKEEIIAARDETILHREDQINESDAIICDSSITCKLGILFVSVKYVLVSVKLVYAYVKLLKI